MSGDSAEGIRSPSSVGRRHGRARLRADVEYRVHLRAAVLRWLSDGGGHRLMLLIRRNGL